MTHDSHIQPPKLFFAQLAVITRKNCQAGETFTCGWISNMIFGMCQQLNSLQTFTVRHFHIILGKKSKSAVVLYKTALKQHLFDYYVYFRNHYNAGDINIPKYSSLIILIFTWLKNNKFNWKEHIKIGVLAKFQNELLKICNTQVLLQLTDIPPTVDRYISDSWPIYHQDMTNTWPRCVNEISTINQYVCYSWPIYWPI